MSYNLVRHLPRYGFRGLNTLETIDLSYNDIREVDERAFEDMRWVTTLKVKDYDYLRRVGPRLREFRPLIPSV